MQFAGLVLILIALLLAPFRLPTQDARARSVLVLDQSEPTGPFYYELFAAFRAALNADTRTHTTVYHESLDLSRFQGPAYEQDMQRHLHDKFQDRQLGVIVAVGVASLEFVLRWRDRLWPGIPVVFAMLDEIDFEQHHLPPDVTGSIVRLPLSDLIKVAHAVVPDLKSVVFVGDPWERQVIFRNWLREKSTAATGLNLTEIVGLSMAETRKRVATLPEHSAIIYSAMYSDGEGVYFTTGLSLGANHAGDYPCCR